MSFTYVDTFKIYIYIFKKMGEDEAPLALLMFLVFLYIVCPKLYFTLRKCDFVFLVYTRRHIGVQTKWRP